MNTITLKIIPSLIQNIELAVLIININVAIRKKIKTFESLISKLKCDEIVNLDYVKVAIFYNLILYIMLKYRTIAFIKTSTLI